MQVYASAHREREKRKSEKACGVHAMKKRAAWRACDSGCGKEGNKSGLRWG